MSSSDALNALGVYVKEEYDFEWQRKQSLETRCFAVATANLAVVTIIALLAQRAGVLESMKVGGVRDLALVALSFYALSVIAALIGAVPLSYPATGANDLTTFAEEVAGVERIEDLTADDLVFELIDVRIGQLDGAQKSNRVKARLVLAAFVLSVLGNAILWTAFGIAL